MALVFLLRIGTILPIAGFAVSLTILALGNLKIIKNKTPETTLKALPMFHVAMLIYAITLILNFFIQY
jgi:4-hydroxybenzoate polyprenyltransferase